MRRSENNPRRERIRHLYHERHGLTFAVRSVGLRQYLDKDRQIQTAKRQPVARVLRIGPDSAILVIIL